MSKMKEKNDFIANMFSWLDCITVRKLNLSFWHWITISTDAIWKGSKILLDLGTRQKEECLSEEKPRSCFHHAIYVFYGIYFRKWIR